MPEDNQQNNDSQTLADLLEATAHQQVELLELLSAALDKVIANQEELNKISHNMINIGLLCEDAKFRERHGFNPTRPSKIWKNF